MIIDAHAHIHKRNGSFEGEMAELRLYAQRFNLARVYLSCVSSEGISYYPTVEHVDMCNEGIYNFCQEDPRRYKGYTYLNPLLSNSVDTLRRGVEDHGAVGVKFEIPSFCDVEEVNPIAEACIRYDIPILIHTFHKYSGQYPDETTGVHVANLARRYPELRILMAHLGGDAYHGIKHIRCCPNVWTDISGSNYRTGEIEYTVKLIGADRVLFGTDAIGAAFLTNLGRVEEAALSDEDKEKILWRNACALFQDPLEV